MGVMTTSGTPSAAAHRTAALSSTTPQHWSWLEHILPMGRAQQERRRGRSAEPGAVRKTYLRIRTPPRF